MARKAKLGTLVGVAEWENLETVADVRRLLRWVVLNMRDGTVEPAHASIFAQIAGVLLKTVQVGAFEERLTRIEDALRVAEVGEDDARGPTSTH